MCAAAAWLNSVKTRTAFPAQSFAYSSFITICCTFSSMAHMGACHGSNMESEGMLVQSCYYGRIGSEATERLLERFGHDGSFLLRDSDTVQGAYCLCVRKAPFVHTYRLVKTTPGWSLQDSGIKLRSFRTLETLIESFRGGSSVPLTDPLDKTQLQDVSVGQEFVYLEM